VRGRLRPGRPRLGAARRLRRRYERPSEVDALIGDPGKAERVLEAQTFGEDLVNVMVDGDVKKLEDELAGRHVRIDQ